MRGATDISILCQAIVGTAPIPQGDEPSIDLLDIEWHERGKRALRRLTRRGRMVRVLLPADQFLDHEVIVARVDGQPIIVNLLPCEIFVIDGASHELAELAYALGNLHVPAEIRRTKILLPASDATEAMLGKLGITPVKVYGRVRPRLDLLPRVAMNLRK